MGLSPTFGARRFPKGERKALWCARWRIPPAAAGGIDAPTPARTVGLPPRGGQYFLSKRKKVPKKASGTVTLAARPAMRRGLRSAVAPSGLSSTLVRFAHPFGKKPFTAHFAGGARYVARSMIGQISPAIRRAPNSPFSAVKMGGPFSLRCLSPLCSAAVDAGQTPMAVFGMLRRGLDGFAAQKAARVSKLYWPFARAARPSVERRSVSASWQEITSDPRAARPVAERR